MFYSFEAERPPQPRTRFILMAPARSGSTMLRHTLNQHPEITCHGEMLGKKVLGVAGGAGAGRRPGELETIRARDLLGFADLYIYGAQGPVVGFKLLHGQPRIEIAELLEALIADAEIRILFLWRRDLIARLASYIGHKKGRNVEGQMDPATGVYRLDLEMAAQDCRNQIAAARRNARLFSGHPCLSVEYEALLHNPAGELDRIADFLGVAPGRMRLPPKPSPAAEPERRPLIDNLEAVRGSLLIASYLDYAWSDVMDASS